MSDQTGQFARHIVEMDGSSIPESAIARAKLAILDTLACIIAGNGHATTRAIRALVMHWSGRPEAQLFGTDTRLPAPMAALANSVSARAVDFDDTYELAPGGGHASAYVVPAALAVAEAEGNVSGRELLNAIAIAQDIYCRFASSVRANSIDTGRDNMFSVFGPMTVAARLLRLDKNCTVNAFGIAYAEAAGEMQMYEESADTVALQQGFRTRAGITAGYLAQAGLAGPHSPLFGRYGFYKVFEPEYDLHALFDSLGSVFVGARLSFKRYPCCKCIHPALDAILELSTAAKFTPDSVVRLRIGTNRLSREFVAEPCAVRWAPRTGIEARFSLPYAAAVAVAKGAVQLADFRPEALDNPAVKRILAVTEVIVDDAIEEVAGHAANAPASIVIQLADGGVLRHRIDKPKGHPDNPAGFSEGVEKLRACATFSDWSISPDQIGRLLDSIHNLDRAPDVAALLSALRYTDAFEPPQS